VIAATISLQLDSDRSHVDNCLTSILDAAAGSKDSRVQRAMRYAVLGGGQRIRPILSLRVARMLGSIGEPSTRAAAAVELLHCASLIVDDLPCMDDSPMRRNRPSVHVEFDQATAILAAFGLVSLAARIVVEFETTETSAARLSGFQIRLLRSLDCSGLLDGQALDLQLEPRKCSRTCATVTELKTVPLFQLAVKAGSLCSELNEDEEALLACLGKEFGLAFQLTDDLIDGEDLPVESRTQLDERIATMHAAISPFGPASSGVAGLLDYLHARVSPSVRS
jgi:farnesyl diphosphate synthase